MPFEAERNDRFFKVNIVEMKPTKQENEKPLEVT